MLSKNSSVFHSESAMRLTGFLVINFGLYFSLIIACEMPSLLLNSNSFSPIL